MKRSKQLLSAGGLLLILTATTPLYADIARPRPSPSAEPKLVMHTSMVVTTDSKANDARLQISQDTLNELRAALGDVPANGSQSSGGISQRLTGSSTRTLMAGLMMFLSLSCAGIWLARSVHTRGQKTVAAFLLATAMVGAVTIVTQANAGPPPSWQWRRLSGNLTKGRPTYASVNIEIVPDGSGVKLIVPVTPEAKPSDE